MWGGGGGGGGVGGVRWCRYAVFFTFHSEQDIAELDGEERESN